MVHPAKGPITVAVVVGTYAPHHSPLNTYGKPAHTGMAPWEDFKALEAAGIAYTSISALR